MLTTLNIFLVFFLVLANGFFVASEFALVGVRRSRIATLAENGDKRAQMERITQGLEAKISPLTTREWFDCRNGINVYFGRFKQMMDCLWKDYLSPMLRQNEAGEIKEQFSPDLQPLHDLYTDMHDFRERIELLRTTKLAHRNLQGEMKGPNYFDCVLNAERWTKYAQELQGNLSFIDKSVA